VSPPQSRPRSGLSLIHIGPARATYSQKTVMSPKPSMVADAHAFLLQSKQHDSKQLQPVHLSSGTSDVLVAAARPGSDTLPGHTVADLEGTSGQAPMQESQTSGDEILCNRSITPTKSATPYSELGSPDALKYSEAAPGIDADMPGQGCQPEAMPEDLSQTSFMRAFCAHGGMDNIHESFDPSGKRVWKPAYKSTPADMKPWQRSCERILSFTTDLKRRELIQGWMWFQPPLPPMKPLSDAEASLGEIKQWRPCHWSDHLMSSKHTYPSVCNGPSFHAGSLPSSPLSQKTGLQQVSRAQGYLKRGRHQMGRPAFRATSDFSSSPRKAARTTHPIGNVSSVLASHGTCHGSKLCSLCNASLADSTATCCKYDLSATCSQLWYL
jgi:hypothetical protein